MTAIYLDYNATAPLRPQVLAAMQEILAASANPSSSHSFGREAKKHLENARRTIADAISVWPDEVIFTASSTEANATALAGDRKLFVSAIEHSSVSKAREAAIIPVTKDGILDLSALDALPIEGGLVSVMLANNETGVIQPVAEVAAICKKRGALFHCDAVQGLGKIPVDMGAIGADMLSISAHKCAGPVGAGALVVRRNFQFTPFLKGGGQESNRRAGTQNVAAIVGFAKAVELSDFAQMKKLRGWLDNFESVILRHGEAMSAGSHAAGDPAQSLHASQDDVIIFGKSVSRLPNTSCIAMNGVSNEVQLMDFDLKGFAVSAGSACSSGRIEPSHVLLAMHMPKEKAASAIRISGGWATTEKEIQDFTSAWQQLANRLMRVA